VEPRFVGALPRRIWIELRERSHGEHFAGVHVHDDTGGADRLELGHRIQQLMFEGLLELARDRQRQRLAAGAGIGKASIERALHPRDAMSVDIGVADHVSGERRLRVETIRLPLDREARLADRVDGLDQSRRGAAAKVEEGLVRAEKREILRLAVLGHQLGELPRERELVPDHLGRVDRDGPGVDGAGERLAVAVDDVAALGDQSEQAFLPPGMVAECGEPEDPKGDERDDAGIDQHAEHQPLVHDSEDLAALADQSEPLGPRRDESGRRGVHWPETLSFADFLTGLSGSGASGSVFARWTCFVIGLAAARPGLSTDFFGAGIAAATGLSVDFVWAGCRGKAATCVAGTSRVPVFRLAWWRRSAVGAPESSVSSPPIGAVLRSGAGAAA